MIRKNIEKKEIIYAGYAGENIWYKDYENENRFMKIINLSVEYNNSIFAIIVEDKKFITVEEIHEEYKLIQINNNIKYSFELNIIGGIEE